MSSRLKVLLVLGHPRKDSLCGALADAFAAGARQAGVDLRRLDLCELRFNPNVIAGSPRNQPLEPAIREAVELVRWADHLVFVFPTWWGTIQRLDTELYRVPLVVSAHTVAIAMLVVVAAVLLSTWTVARHLRRMDVPAILNARQ